MSTPRTEAVLSVVVPVYRNEESVPDLLDAMDVIAVSTNEDVQAVFVVDGSPDRSFELLRDLLPERRYASRLVLLSRNFGSFVAIRAGLEVAAGDRIAVMTADLQEPPELVVQMNERLEEADVDVVLAARADRADPFLSRMLSRLYWALYRRYVVRDIPEGGIDVFACTKRFRDQLLRLEERHSSLIAQVFWLGFRRATVSYARRPRRHGKSAWSFGKRLEYFSDSVFSFTDLPLRILVRMGGAVAIVSGIFGVAVAALRVAGVITVPGYAAIVILVVFFGSLNLFGLGIVGSYAWRTYENTKERPLHVVLEDLTFHPRRE